MIRLSDTSEHPSQTYARLLSRHGLGYALYRPQPISALPIECKKKGVSIGDVGMITPDGGFDLFFNIYLPADDPMNNGRVPPNFIPMLPSISPNEDVDVNHAAWRAG